MNIGKVAELSGVPAKTIRYYESIGLTLPPARSESGYRTYAEEDVHMLKFVARARSLGFSIDDCRGLLALYRDRGRASADVKRIAEEHIGEIERKIAELQSMQKKTCICSNSWRGPARSVFPSTIAGGFWRFTGTGAGRAPT